MTPLELSVLKDTQESLNTLINKVRGAAVGWPYTKRKTIIKWKTDLIDLQSRLRYLYTINVPVAQPAVGCTHHCTDQYCYNDTNHRCHKENCEH